jgi:2-methylcitrate dehydratase PrpD
MDFSTTERSARLVDFIHDIRLGGLPGNVQQQARRCLLDTLGVAVASTRLPLAGIVRDFSASFIAPGDQPGVRLLLDGRRASLPGAALASAAMIDSLDGHDGHVLCKGHVGVCVIPAALHFAEFTGGGTWDELLGWVVLGYEIATRAGIVLHATSTEFSSSGAWNALGVAAIGANALRLDRAQTRNALGIAEYYAPRSPLMRVVRYPSMLKDGSTFGAFAGTAATLLAAKGFTGDPIGLVDLVVDQAAGERWDSVGRDWLILDQYFKPFPVCRWTHPTVLAIQALKEKHPDWCEGDVKSMKVRAFAEAVSLYCRTPPESDAAQYSLPFVAAAALVHGDVAIEHLSDQGLRDERVLFHSERVELIEDSEFSSRFPAERWSQVLIELKDGRLLDSGPTTSIGDPNSPLSDSFIEEKFFDNCAPVLGDLACKRMHEAVMHQAHPLQFVLDLLGSDPQSRMR